MAGILQRFSSIMSANINSLLDKAEDPEKMVDQTLREMQQDLGEVKAQTAAVMAEETKAKRLLDECNEEIAKMLSYAEKALKSGNEGDAKQFISKKQQLETKKVTLEASYQAAANNAGQLKAMYEKLESDIKSLNERKAQIKAKIETAKAQEKINNLTTKAVSSVNIEDGMAAFERMESKADAMLDKANAMAELNKLGSASDSVEDLAKKYDSSDSASSSVEDELAAMKASLGL